MTCLLSSMLSSFSLIHPLLLLMINLSIPLIIGVLLALLPYVHNFWFMLYIFLVSSLLFQHETSCLQGMFGFITTPCFLGPSSSKLVVCYRPMKVMLIDNIKLYQSTKSSPSKFIICCQCVSCRCEFECAKNQSLLKCAFV